MSRDSDVSDIRKVLQVQREMTNCAETALKKPLRVGYGAWVRFEIAFGREDLPRLPVKEM